MTQTNYWSEETRGLCPTCLRDVPATIFEDDGRIWIRQTCTRHGEFQALLASDSAEYLRLRQYVPNRSGANCCCGPGEACGTDGSAGEASGPPVCVLLLEITQACNLRCPTCYADAQGHDFMTEDEARQRLDTFFEVQPRLDVLMLSGGEPTIHPKFADILSLALSYPIGRVLINTNGLRLGQSEVLVETLAAHKERVELYFSFSSFRESGHLHFYGRDLRREKRAALEKVLQGRFSGAAVSALCPACFVRPRHGVLRSGRASRRQRMALLGQASLGHFVLGCGLR